MELLLLSADDLERALPMRDAIGAMKQAFAALSSGRASSPQRLHVDVAGAEGIMLCMGAHLPGAGPAAKIVSAFPGNASAGKPVINGLVVVLDEQTGEPVALCDGRYLTALRTGAASGAATDLLARRDAKRGALIGCGAQGQTQLLAMCAARDLDEVRLFDGAEGSAARFVEAMQPRVEATLIAAASAADAVADADVICTATPSTEALFAGEVLKPGAHINAVGSFRLDMRELDDRTIERSRVFVDSREACLAEAGELVAAAQAGITAPDKWTELGEMVSGTAPGRESDEQITLFKSVGQAVQDAAAAGAALGRARALGLGSTARL